MKWQNEPRMVMISVREKLMKGVFLVSALFSVFALVTITAYLLASGIPFIAKTGFGQFILGTRWAPLADTPSYGIFPMIVASLYVTALSTLIGVGIGLFTAVCLYKFCPRKLVAPIRQMVNLLAGIPSVIYGLFGMTIIVPFIRDHVSPRGVGYGILSSSLVLAIMVLPTVVSVSLDAMRAVPESYYEGALALGATKEAATFRVMLPAAKSGILAGVVLAVGRALGGDHGGHDGHREQPDHAEEPLPERAYHDLEHRHGRDRDDGGRRFGTDCDGGRAVLLHAPAQRRVLAPEA